MSKTRKILSIVLAVVMAFSVFSICTFADTDTATWTVEVTNTDGSALPASIPTGTIVKVTVKLQTNFYVGTVGLPVYFSEAFEYVDGSKVQAEIYGAGATRFGFNDNFDAGTGYNAVMAVYVPNSGAAGVASPIYSTATTILTFNLEAVSEASAAEVKLDASKQKSASNIGGPFYCGSRATSDVNTDETTTGQTFNVPAATTIVIANAAATPVLSGIDTGYVDDVNGYVYGIPVGEDAADYFEVENGTFDVSGTATGETLTVYDSNDNVYATYTVIIFGDVDGSGDVTLLDEEIVYGGASGVDISDDVVFFAADVDASGDITLLDDEIVYGGASGLDVTVNPYV
ncbi:MAG: hypothetical protein J5877_00195 [Clostridia bacterium]|nr:hypothetical protein [Clostridia bacterium]